MLILAIQSYIVLALYLFIFPDFLFGVSLAPFLDRNILEILRYSLSILIIMPLFFSFSIGENGSLSSLFMKKHQYFVIFSISKFSASDGSKLSLSHLSNLLLREDSVILKNPNSPAPRFVRSWNSIPPVSPENVISSVILCRKSKFRWIWRKIPTQFSIISQSEEHTSSDLTFHFYTRSSSQWEFLHKKLIAYNYSPHILEQEKTQVPSKIRWQDNVLPLSIAAILWIILYRSFNSSSLNIILASFVVALLVFFILNFPPPAKWYVPTRKLMIPLFLIIVHFLPW